MRRAITRLCAVAALASSPGARADEGDAPYLEILQSTGAIDGPSEGGVGVPRWERVRLELRLKNRLPVEVRDVELEVALVSSSGTAEAEAAVIPGWSFRETFTEPPVPALDESYLRILRELPARRTSPPADEIAYRAQIESYRLAPPDLDTAIRLLGSSHESDQRAAMKSYELDTPEDGEPDRQAAALLGRGLAAAIAELPEEPTASDALRMLFAVRAIGTLGDATSLRMLLELPGARDGRTWGRAVLDLAARMVTVSERNEPRLRVLPTWARESTMLEARAEDVLEDAVSDAILRMGDAAVPRLLSESHLGAVPGVRARAQRLLHALGRSTVRSQLSLRDRAARLAVVEVLGVIGSPEPVPVLVEMLRSRDGELRDAARKAIERIGVPAMNPLVAALGTPNDDALLAVLGALGAASPGPLAQAALRYGVTRQGNEAPAELVGRLRQHLFDARRTRLVADVERALELGREGAYTDCFQRLDAVFNQDPEVYMRFAKPIAETYLARAKRLHARGDYDAAATTLRTGQSITRLPEADQLLAATQIALARGYLELGDLDRAEEALAAADASRTNGEVRTLEAKLLAMKADVALAAGDYGKARTMINRARALRHETPELERADRRLLLAENLAIVIVLALFIPAIALAIIVVVRRRVQAARLQRLAIDIDRDKAPSPSERGAS